MGVHFRADRALRGPPAVLDCPSEEVVGAHLGVATVVEPEAGRVEQRVLQTWTPPRVGALEANRAVRTTCNYVYMLFQKHDHRKTCAEGSVVEMKANELVWRTLVDSALDGNRTWRNVGDLAYAAGVPASAAYLALERLESNGSIDRYRRGGLAVVSLEKVLTMLCAWRNQQRGGVLECRADVREPLRDPRLAGFGISESTR